VKFSESVVVFKVLHWRAESKVSGVAMAQAAATGEVAKASGIKVHKLSELNADEVQALRARPRIDFTSIFETVCILLLVVRPLHTLVHLRNDSLSLFVQSNIKCRV
jgi:hypothetical protein